MCSAFMIQRAKQSLCQQSHKSRSLTRTAVHTLTRGLSNAAAPQALQSSSESLLPVDNLRTADLSSRAHGQTRITSSLLAEPTPAAQRLSEVLRRLKLPRGLVVGAEEMQMANEHIDFSSRVEGAARFLRSHQLPERKLATFFAYRSLLALQVDVAQLERIVDTLLLDIGFSQPEISSIVRYRSGVSILEVAHRLGAQHVIDIFAVLKTEFGTYSARELLLRNAYLMRLSPSWLQENISALRRLFGTSGDSLVSQMALASSGSVLMMSPRVRDDTFEWFKKSVFGDDLQETRRVLASQWRLMCSKLDELSGARKVLVGLLGEEETQRIVRERPVLVTSLNADTLELLLDLGYDVKSILLAGKTSRMLGVPPEQVRATFEWLCDKLGKERTMSLSRFLSFRVATNLQPTWDACLSIGVEAADLRSTAGVELLAFSHKNVVAPFGRLVAFHNLELSSAQIVNSIRRLSAREIAAMGGRMDRATELMSRSEVELGDLKVALEEDRERILKSAKRSRATATQLALQRRVDSHASNPMTLSRDLEGSPSEPTSSTQDGSSESTSSSHARLSAEARSPTTPSSSTLVTTAPLFSASHVSACKSRWPLIQSFECSACDKHFSSPLLLKRHRVRHILAYGCDLCGERFKESSGLASHLERKHTQMSDRDRFECECGDWFSDEKSLNEHKASRGPEHAASQYRRIEWSNDRALLPVNFPVTDQSLQHTCTADAKRAILNDGRIRPSTQDESSPRSTLDFNLSREDAPPVSFFSLSPESEGPILPITLFPSSVEAGEVCHRVHIALDDLLSNDSRHQRRLYFVGMGNVQARRYRSNARAVVLLAQESDWEWADEHCTRLDIDDNTVLFRSQLHGIGKDEDGSVTRYQWRVATRVRIGNESAPSSATDNSERATSRSDAGSDSWEDEDSSHNSANSSSSAGNGDGHRSGVYRPLQVMVAVSGAVDLQTLNVSWSRAARMRQVGGVVQCPFCDYSAPSTQYSRCRDHVLARHTAEEFVEHPLTGGQMKVGSRAWRKMIADEELASRFEERGDTGLEAHFNRSRHDVWFMLDTLDWYHANGKDLVKTAEKFKVSLRTLGYWAHVEARLRESVDVDSPASAGGARRTGPTRHKNDFKIRALDWYHEHGEDRAMTAEKFGVPYRTFYKWTRIESVLRDLARTRAGGDVQQLS